MFLWPHLWVCSPRMVTGVVCWVKEATLLHVGGSQPVNWRPEQIKKADKEGTNLQAPTQPDCGPGHGLILPQARADTWTLPGAPACRPRVLELLASETEGASSWRQGYTSWFWTLSKTTSRSTLDVTCQRRRQKTSGGEHFLLHTLTGIKTLRTASHGQTLKYMRTIPENPHGQTFTEAWAWGCRRFGEERPTWENTPEAPGGKVGVFSHNRVKAWEGSGVEPSSTAKEADHSEDGWQRVHQEDQIVRSACGLNCKGKIA